VDPACFGQWLGDIPAGFRAVTEQADTRAQLQGQLSPRIPVQYVATPSVPWFHLLLFCCTVKKTC